MKQNLITIIMIIKIKSAFFDEVYLFLDFLINLLVFVEIDHIQG